MSPSGRRPSSRSSSFGTCATPASRGSSRWSRSARRGSERPPGWSLQEILSRLPVDGRAVPWAAVVGVGRALCSVLAYAHAKADPEGRPWGFVASRERGLETRRVFVDAAGEVKLADLGLGALLESSRWSKGVAALHLSRAFYLAPEAVRGEVTTSAADMFCLGWMLWDLLSGRRLFAGASDFDTLKQLIAGAPPGALQLPGVPAALERLIAGCLARVPAARPSATEAGRELEALMAPQEARQALGRFVAGATKDLQEGLRAELVTWSRY